MHIKYDCSPSEPGAENGLVVLTRRRSSDDPQLLTTDCQIHPECSGGVWSGFAGVMQSFPSGPQPLFRRPRSREAIAGCDREHLSAVTRGISGDLYPPTMTTGYRLTIAYVTILT